MKRRDFLKGCLAVGAAGLLAGCSGEFYVKNNSKKTNILFILVDDMGWRDLGCYGNEIHETPNIDKFASQSMRFTDAYAACPVCSPTRASIMAGRYPSRTGITNWLPGDNYQGTPLLCERTAQFMKLEETTLAEALKAGGYQTAFVGKWHLGREPYYPQHQGFDNNVAGNHWGHPHKGYFSPYQMEHLEDGPKGEYLTDRLTSEAIQVMDDFSRKEKPWLMVMSYYTVHAPFHAKAEKIKKYKDKARQAKVKLNANYAAMVESLDENVGRVLQWLDEKELRKNTIHPEWTDPGSFAAGILGKVRFIYTPNRGVYNWKGLQVKGLEPDVPYRMLYFDPVRGTRDDVGIVINSSAKPEFFPGHTEQLVFEDGFDDADASKWTDHGSATRREDGRLVGGKGMVTTFKDFNEANAMVSVDALSDAEAGIILRFHDYDHYVVGFYSPSLKCIYIHDRRNGDWGSPLGRVNIPKIGRNIRLTAAVSGPHATLVVSDGKSEYRTPVVTLENNKPGPVGVWLYQIGERQEYDNFAVSRTLFVDPEAPGQGKHIVLQGGDFTAPNVPSPQDWVLVLERAGK